MDIVHVGEEHDIRVRSVDTLESLVQRGRQVKGAEGVTLLGSRAGSDVGERPILHEEGELSGFAVAGCCPRKKVRERLADGLKDASLGDSIERIVAIHLQRHMGRMRLEVGLNCVHDDVAAPFGGDAKLGRDGLLSITPVGAEVGAKLGGLLATNDLTHQLA
eukprot:7241481-Lingulodinium_polyedra.AAC.1